MSDKVQLIKKEIERQIEEGKVKCQQSQENNDHESFVAWSEHIATCGKILVFINSLSEKTSDDLEKDAYIKSSIELPKELTPIWVRIDGSMPRKMYRIRNHFYYYNKKLSKNGNYSSIGNNVFWKYCKIK